MRRTVHPGAIASTLLGLPLLAACGSSPAAPPAHRAAAPGTRPTHVYRLSLSGQAEAGGGARSGHGFAIIALHGTSTVCWRFAHLHGFVDATGAEIDVGHARQTGAALVRLGRGPRLHHQGCVTTSRAAVSEITRAPASLYLNVTSQARPTGAVRAQL